LDRHRPAAAITLRVVILQESPVAHPPTSDVLIIGAGIVGASIAWHLARRGLRARLIDASGPAAGASGASDGAVSVASKRAGTMMALAGESLRYCGALARDGGVLAGVFHPRPSFVFASGEGDDEALDGLVARLGETTTPVSVIRDSGPGASSVRGLSDEVSRILELTGEGHMLGYAATAAFLAASEAERIWPCRVDRLEAHRAHVTVHTDRGQMTATQVVVANGLGSGALIPALPILPRSGQLAVTDRAAGPDWPALPGPLTSAAYLRDKSRRGGEADRAPVVIDPLSTGQLLIGSSREDDGTASQTDFETLRRILASGVACLPALARRRVIRVFAGVRAASADGYPIVGPVPGLPNVIAATGFEGDGICLAPLIGREVAKLIAGEPAHEDLAALAPGRFAAQAAVAQ
jgi:glycine/D-amino acid oxidase-like deaminating enzyme